MRAVITAAIILLSTDARAYTCADVRAWVAQYGIARVLVMARVYGVTAEQRRQAWACLRSK